MWIIFNLKPLPHSLIKLITMSALDISAILMGLVILHRILVTVIEIDKRKREE